MNRPYLRTTTAALLWLALLMTARPYTGVAQTATETPTATATVTTTAATATPPAASPTAQPPAPGNLTITSVQPGTLVNDQAVELIVTGNGFVDGSVVVLNNFGGLETFFVSASVLRATVPPGLPPGRYDVRVVNPDAAHRRASP